MTALAPLALAAQLVLAAEPMDLTTTEPDTTLAEDTTEMVFSDSATIAAYKDSLESVFTYAHGHIELPGGAASLDVPSTFKFLDRSQSQRVLTELWGNPPEQTENVLGMILPEDGGVLSQDLVAYVVEYTEDGYVKDDDADDIDYDDLLKKMQKGEEEANRERVKMGYEPAYLVGWATKPFYDKERKILHWAKEIKFGDSAAVNTLNYNIRVLGRKGFLELNAVAAMPQLELVKQRIPDVLSIAKFNDGYKYEQFDSKVDNVAAWTIGGLVAGKILLKAGIFAGLLKFLAPLWKFIVLGFAAIGGWFAKTFGSRKKKEQGPPPAPPLPPANES